MCISIFKNLDFFKIEICDEILFYDGVPYIFIFKHQGFYFLSLFFEDTNEDRYYILKLKNKEYQYLKFINFELSYLKAFYNYKNKFIFYSVHNSEYFKCDIYGYEIFC